MRAWAIAAILSGLAITGCPTSRPAGACLSSTDCPVAMVCLAGECQPPPACTPSGAEICGNDVDENCNGSADDVCPIDMCGDGTCDPAESATSCAEDCGAGASRTYVVSTMDAGEESPDGMAFGFDLDTRVGGIEGLACTDAMDFVSSVTGEMGIDNQLGTTLLPILEMMGGVGATEGLSRSIQEGALLIVFTVSNINNFENDPTVRVEVALATAEGGMGPTLDVDGTGLAPGQPFTRMTDLGTVDGTITDGRLRFSIPMLPLTLRVSDASAMTLVLHEVVFGGHIAADGLTEGEIGGVVTIDDLVMAAEMFVAGVSRATLESLTQPDMHPDDTGDHCDAISAGFGFEPVEATLD